MAKNKTQRLRPNVLQANLDAFAALQAIVGYNPSNAQFKLENVTASHGTMGEQQTLEVQKQAAAAAQRDATCDSEWNFHDMILGAKNQVKAQFGENSDEYASLGMKKKSEYKTGRRKSTPTDDGTT